MTVKKIIYGQISRINYLTSRFKKKGYNSSITVKMLTKILDVNFKQESKYGPISTFKKAR